MTLDEIHPDTMTKFVGASFAIEDEQFTGLFVVLKDIVTHEITKDLETFSLNFLGPIGCLLPQGIHKLKHSELGELDLFMVPTGKDKVSYQYEAVFNRML